MKKRIVSFLLVLALTLPLLSAAAAERVMVSRQSLRVDGKVVVCQKYNIDDRNYFMLRDLAMLLKGTGSRFSVSWDEETRCVAVVTGEDYAPDGSELDLSQGDQSETAVRSSQSIYINGELRTDLTVYNIGDHNFFQLKELGAALGFFVDYDQPTNTAVVISRAFSQPTPWLVQEETELGAEAFGERTEQYRCSTYDAEGRLLMSTGGFAGNEYESFESRSYDELGRPVKEVRGSRNKETGEPGVQTVTTWEYDRWGNLAKETVDEGEGSTETTYTYDDRGALVRKWQGDSGYEYVYDEAGKLIRVTYSLWDGITFIKEYAYDEGGHLLLERELDPEGVERASTAYTWEGDLCASVLSAIGSYEAATDYTYDASGNLSRKEENYSGMTAVTTYAYDASGRMLRWEWRCGEESQGSSYEYDEAGNLLRETFTTSADPIASAARHQPAYTAEYAYDGEGLLIRKKLIENGTDITETWITYDRAAGKMTTLIEHSRVTESAQEDRE